MENEMIVFSGTSNPALGEEICKILGAKPGEIQISSFADGETNVKILDNVRGKDTFVIQPTSPPVNENLMQLLIVMDALKRASAKRITAVIPYFGYARQDRKLEGRVPISAKLVANLLVAAGANRILTLELHAGQIQGFFDIPVDNLSSSILFAEKFKNIKFENPIIISPDAGGVDRARDLAKVFGIDLAVVDKRRSAPNEAKVFHIIGEVKGKTCLIFDDIVDTAGTATEVAKVLKEKGSGDIYLLVCHPVFSGNAYEKIEASPVKKVFVTDTITLKRKSPKIEVISVAALLAGAIERIHSETSISSLFSLDEKQFRK